MRGAFSSSHLIRLDFSSLSALNTPGLFIPEHYCNPQISCLRSPLPLSTINLVFVHQQLFRWRIWEKINTSDPDGIGSTSTWSVSSSSRTQCGSSCILWTHNTRMKHIPSFWVSQKASLLSPSYWVSLEWSACARLQDIWVSCNSVWVVCFK